MPHISICIPAYKRVESLRRLIDSVITQSFTDYEVVITDDSPDDQVKLLCESYNQKIALRYLKNPHSLGTPENWNEAIRSAKGQWVKLMHDDDWFESPNSLAVFAAATKNNHSSFIFSAYHNCNLSTGNKKTVRLSYLQKFLLRQNPLSLLARNVIGPPSTCLYKKNEIAYDCSMKWLVDMDFYIRYLKKGSFLYIDQPLVCIGIHDTQVTVFSKLKPEVELPEHFSLLQKTGHSAFHNVLFYDAFWRLFRNLGVRTLEDVKKYVDENEIPDEVRDMLKFQQTIPPAMLRFGPASKLFMLLSYTVNRVSN